MTIKIIRATVYTGGIIMEDEPRIDYYFTEEAAQAMRKAVVHEMRRLAEDDDEIYRDDQKASFRSLADQIESSVDDQERLFLQHEECWYCTVYNEDTIYVEEA